MAFLNRLQLVIVGLLSVSALLGQQGAPALVFPQIADGGGVRFEVSLTNPGTRPDSGEILFKDGNGQPLTIDVDGAAVTSISYSIAGGGSFTVQSDGAGALKTGYAVVASNSDVSFISGSIVYDLNGQVSVPGVKLSKEFHSFVEKNSDNNSGIAVANPGDESLDIDAVLLGETGIVSGNQIINLQAGQQSPRFIDRIFDTLGPNFRGSLHLRSEDDFAAVALKQDSANSLTTLAGAQVAFPSLGFAAVVSEEDGQLAIAVNEAGEEIIVLGGVSPVGADDTVQGAIWIGRGGGSVTAFLGDDGLPKTALSDNFVFVFANYQVDSVDVGVIDPSGQTQIVREVQIDPDDLAALMNPDSSGGSVGAAGAGSDIWRVLKIGGLTIGVVGCSVAAVNSAGLAAPVTAPICKTTAVSLALTLANLLVEDNPVIQEFATDFGLIGCGTGLAAEDPIDASTRCANLIGTAGSLIDMAVREERDTRQDEIEALRFDIEGCQYSITPEMASFPSSGGTGQFSIETSPTCSWEIRIDSNFLAVVEPSELTGSGPATIDYSVDTNPTANSRAGTMDIEGNTFSVTQDGVDCSFSIEPTSRDHGPGAENDSVLVNAPTGCAWTALSNDSWISVTSGQTGDGNGTVNYSLEANDVTSPRNGTLTIAGQSFTVTQAAMEVQVCVQAPAGLISWWPGEGNANDITDGNPGVLGGDAAFSQGWVDSAFEFSGAGEVSVLDSQNLNPENVTVEAWINTSIAPVSRPLLIAAKSGPGANFGYELLLTDEQGKVGQARFVVLAGSTEEGMHGDITGRTDVTDGQFHHIVGTWDGTATKIYVDGDLEGAAFVFSDPIAYAAGPFYIGRRESNGIEDFFTGLIDEVSIYNRALSDSEVAGIFDAGPLGKCKP